MKDKGALLKRLERQSSAMYLTQLYINLCVDPTGSWLIIGLLEYAIFFFSSLVRLGIQPRSRNLSNFEASFQSAGALRIPLSFFWFL